MLIIPSNNPIPIIKDKVKKISAKYDEDRSMDAAAGYMYRSKARAAAEKCPARRLLRLTSSLQR